MRDHLAVDASLADAPRDQLGVLGAEVDDEDEICGLCHGFRPSGALVVGRC